MPVTLYRLRYKPAKSIGNGKLSLLGLYHWCFRFDLQYQAFAALALSFVNMKKKNIAWNTDVPLTSHWVCLHLPSSREMFYCIPLVILQGASCMFFAGLMLCYARKSGSLWIIYHSQDFQTKSGNTRGYYLSSAQTLRLQQQELPAVIHHSALQGGRAGFAEYKTSWQEQLLKQSKQRFFPRHPAPSMLPMRASQPCADCLLTPTFSTPLFLCL